MNGKRLKLNGLLKKVTGTICQFIAIGKGSQSPEWYLSPWFDKLTKLSLGLLILSLSLLLSTSTSHAAWFDNDWQYRKQVTIDDAMVPNNDQTNIPVLIYRATDNDLRDNAQSDGSDIVFTSSDETTQLSHEIEFYDNTNGNLVAWVKVPTLNSSGGSATDTILYMYYGDTDHATNGDQENITDVWSNNYAGVWHLDESPANGVAGHLDSTAAGINGTPQNFAGAAGSTTNATGRFDGADEFDGANDYITMGNNFDNDGTNPQTVMAWVNVDAAAPGSTNSIFSKKNTAGNFEGWGLTVGVNLGVDWNLGAGFRESGLSRLVEGTTSTFSFGTWSFIAMTYDGSRASAGLNLYVNGNNQATTVFNDSFAAGDSSTATHINIAAENNGADNPFEGFVDEVRISSVERDSDWIMTQYRNQSDYFAGVPQDYVSLGSETQRFTITGNIYTNEAQSANVGAGVTVGISVNGGAKTTVTTTAGGAFSFSNPASIAVNDTVLLFVDNHGSYESNYITQAVTANASISGLEMYTNKIVLSHETAGPMTNTLLATADGSADDDIHYTIAGSNVDFDDNYEVWIYTGKTYTPGGTVELDDFEIEGTGTFSPAGNTVTVHGNWVVPAGGVFTSSGTVVFDGATTQTIDAGGAGTGVDDSSKDFNNLTITGTTLQLVNSELEVDGTLQIQSTETLDLNGQTLDLNGVLDNPGTLQLEGTETLEIGTFDSLEGRVLIDGSTGTITSVITTYYNLEFDEVVNGQTYTLPDSNIIINGVLTLTDGSVVYDDDKNLTINDNGGTGTALSITANASLSNTGTGDLTLGGGVSNSGTITLDSGAGGSSTDDIQLRSTNTTLRNWQGSGTFSITDVDVSHQTAIGGTPNSIVATSSTDTGSNNTNWLFMGGSLSSVSVVPASLVESATGNVTVSFTTTSAIPLDGRIIVTFPAGFTVATTTATSTSDLDGSLGVALGGQTVTITRSGGSNFTAGGTVDDLILNGITNPNTTGATGTFPVSTENSATTTIDSGTGGSVTLTPAPASSTTSLLDSSGSSTSTYTIGSTTLGSVYVSVTDTDENQNAAGIETVIITLSSSLTSDSETITLTETGVNTGIFSNLSSGLALEADDGAVSGNSILEIRSNDTITASYTDDDDGTDTSIDTATIDSIDNTFSISLDMTQGSVKKGDILQGTLSITNMKSSIIQDTDVVLTLPQEVRLLEGSYSVTKGDASITSLSNNNRETLLRIPTIGANNTNELSFNLIVGSQVRDGEILDITIHAENG